jgi:hypothetical protein
MGPLLLETPFKIDHSQFENKLEKLFWRYGISRDGTVQYWKKIKRYDTVRYSTEESGTRYETVSNFCNTAGLCFTEMNQSFKKRKTISWMIKLMKIYLAGKDNYWRLFCPHSKDRWNMGYAIEYGSCNASLTSSVDHFTAENQHCYLKFLSFLLF